MKVHIWKVSPGHRNNTARRLFNVVLVFLPRELDVKTWVVQKFQKELPSYFGWDYFFVFFLLVGFCVVTRLFTANTRLLRLVNTKTGRSVPPSEHSQFRSTPPAWQRQRKYALLLVLSPIFEKPSCHWSANHRNMYVGKWASRSHLRAFTSTYTTNMSTEKIRE